MNRYTQQPGHLIPILRSVDRLGWPVNRIGPLSPCEIAAAASAERAGLIKDTGCPLFYRLTPEGRRILNRWRSDQPGGTKGQ